MTTDLKYVYIYTLSMNVPPPCEIYSLSCNYYTAHVIAHYTYIYSFPPEWIKGNKYPRGIPYNHKLSKLDKKLVRKFYGPPRSAKEAKADIAPVDSTPR